MDNKKRQGRVTSSQAYRIMEGVTKPSKAFYTYAKEISAEIILGCPVGTEVNARAVHWGSLMEHVLFDNLTGFDYEMTHNETIVSKISDFHSGTPDMEKPKICVGEIKCYYRSSFFEFSENLRKKNINIIKKEHKKEYWQVVSNSVLAETPNAELFSFMPKKKILLGVFEKIKDTDYLEQKGLNPSNYIYFTKENIESFNYIPDECDYPMISSFEFEVPKEDKELLCSRIKMMEEEVKLRLSNRKTI